MTELGESASESPEPPADKEFKAEVISIRFTDNHKAAHNNAQITGDHWPAAMYLGKYSQKAAVYSMGSAAAQKVELKIKVTSKGYSGTGEITGMGSTFEFIGDVPLTSGEHNIVVKLKDPPETLAWLRGHVSWGIETSDLCCLAGTTFIELFFVFDNPADQVFFRSKGVWTEALRYLFKNGRLSGEDVEADAIAKVARLCFNISYHQYEIYEGRPEFGGASGRFELANYMEPVKQTVNCYDQTYAIIVFSGALGLTVGGIFLKPFGFLKSTNLVGYGSCNNPFPEQKYLSERLSSPTVKIEDFLMVATDDPDRMPFGNHMFCEFTAKIYDACAGPATGSSDRAGYAAAVVDASTSLYSLYSSFRPGTVADMVPISRVGADLKSVM